MKTASAVLAAAVLLSSAQICLAANRQRTPLDLIVCVSVIGDVGPHSVTVDDFKTAAYGAGLFAAVIDAASADDAKSCDATIKLSTLGSSSGLMLAADVYSSRSKKLLFHAEKTKVWGNGYVTGVAIAIYDRFANDASLTSSLQAERNAPAAAAAAATPAPVQAPAPAVAAAPHVSDVDSPAYHSPERPNDFALVVGISEYRDVPEAEFAEQDARIVKKHLLALGYPERNIMTLFGDRATKSTLADKIENWLPLNVKENSTVFVYYSGHGAPDPAQGLAYLVPWDGDPESLHSTAYPVKRLYEKLGALKAKHVIVALDSCFSGAGGRSVLAKGARPLVSKIDMGSQDSQKITTLTAAGADQISGVIESEGHGAFTYYLLKGLNGAAADDGGHVTLSALYDYLKPQVQDEAHRHEREQTPQFVSSSADSASLRLR